ELSLVFQDIGEEPGVQAVVVTGAGRAFCAGGDIQWLQSAHRNTVAIKTIMQEGRKIIENLLQLEAPVIAAVNGDAIGLGATIALFCDVIYAAETTRISDPHVRVGLVAGDGGAVIWPALIG